MVEGTKPHFTCPKSKTGPYTVYCCVVKLTLWYALSGVCEVSEVSSITVYKLEGLDLISVVWCAFFGIRRLGHGTANVVLPNSLKACQGHSLVSFWVCF